MANSPPTIPGSAAMTIRGLDSIYHNPLVAMTPPTPHRLEWTPSTDPDAGDAGNIVYEIQIATQYDFGTDWGTGSSSIVVDIQNIHGSSYDWASSPKFGQLYWRIRASDGKQFSDWSMVGYFRVNQPPNRVTNLVVQPV